MSIFSHPLRTRESYKSLPWKEWQFFKKHYSLLKKQAILANIEKFFRTQPQMHSFTLTRLNKKDFKNSGIYRKNKRNGIVLINDDIVLRMYDKEGKLLESSCYNLWFKYFNDIGYKNLNFIAAYLKNMQRKHRFAIYKRVSLLWPRYNQVISQWQMRVDKPFNSAPLVRFDNALLPLFIISHGHWDYLNKNLCFVNFYDLLFESNIVEMQKCIWDIEYVFKKHKKVDSIHFHDHFYHIRNEKKQINFDVNKKLIVKKTITKEESLIIEYHLENLCPIALHHLMDNPYLSINKMDRFIQYDKMIINSGCIDKKILKDIKIWNI